METRKKLALSIDSLRVESFEPSIHVAGRGTVHAASDTNHVRLCTYTDCSCPDTCDGWCGNSMTCAGGSCASGCVGC